MIKFAKIALASMVAVGVMSSASASPFFIDTGTDAAFDSNGSTKTGIIDELGYTGTRATSIYLGSPTAIGTTVIDTNDAGVMNFFGFSAGAKTALAGNTVNFSYPLDPSQLNVNALNFPSDVNGFTSGESPFKYGLFATAPGNGLWGLTYTYRLNGVTSSSVGGSTANQVTYTSGYFDVYYQDESTGTNASIHDGQKVLRLNVTGSEFQGVNLSVYGNVDYGPTSGVDITDPFVKNLFNTEAGGTFFSNAAAVSWIIDTNVQPPIPTANQLVQLAPGGPLFRQANLDGSITFNVPEPTSIALIGLALAGAGVASSRRRKA